MLLADGADRPSRETQGGSLPKTRKKEQQDEVKKEAAGESQTEDQRGKDRIPKRVRIQRSHTLHGSTKYHGHTENYISTKPAT